MLRIQLWDVAGPERFRSIATSYLRGAHGVFVFFDVGDLYSFENVRHWAGQVEG
jgi:Ras-related protein Rab-1A